MNKVYYSKLEPGWKAEVLGGPDEKGYCPAYVVTPEGRFVSGVKLHEWSDIPVVPIPESVSAQGYLVIYGDDPALPEFQYYMRETDAAVDVSKRKNAFGYVPVVIEAAGMVPSTP